MEKYLSRRYEHEEELEWLEDNKNEGASGAYGDFNKFVNLKHRQDEVKK